LEADPPVVEKLIVAAIFPATDGLSGSFAVKVIVAGVAVGVRMLVGAQHNGANACKVAAKQMRPPALRRVVLFRVAANISSGRNRKGQRGGISACFVGRIIRQT
jgi:hypothetical protein